MSVTEIADRTWRIESRVGPRNLFEYLIAGDDAAVLVDTGTAETPREAILPALQDIGLQPSALRLVIVTHPDLDHQGGLAELEEELPEALTACGFADRGLVSEPERLVTDRYGAYEVEHGVGYSDEEKAWQRSVSGAPATIDLTFSGGEELDLGGRRLRVIHTPGHSAGHLSVHEPQTGLLFCADAVHWRMCPAADGYPALPPTYEDVDPYLRTIDRIEALAPRELHSGHWPTRIGPEVDAFLSESREFVRAMDDAIEERLDEPATLRELCEHLDARLGPFGADPVNLMFATHGHVRRLVGSRRVSVLDPFKRPPRYQRTAP